jgi:threonine/homoserine/homoserine lactone efflux protein
MSFGVKALMGSIFAVITFAWFVLLSYFVTHRFLKKHLARFQIIITKSMGVILCVLAAYVAFGS